jgi:hypothetical protein
MFQKFSKVCLAITLLSMITGCASIINGRRQEIAVSSAQSGVTVSDGVQTWTTPAHIIVSRKNPQLLTFSKPGYETQTVHLYRSFSGITFLNVLLVPLWPIGVGIDALSGGMWTLEPDTVAVDLRPAASK